MAKKEVDFEASKDLVKAFKLKETKREGARTVSGLEGRIKIGLEADLGYDGLVSNLGVSEE